MLNDSFYDGAQPHGAFLVHWNHWKANEHLVAVEQLNNSDL